MSLTMLYFLTRSISMLARLFVTRMQGINANLYACGKAYLNVMTDKLTGEPGSVFIEWSS